MPDIAEMRRILDIISHEEKMPPGTWWDQGFWFKPAVVWEIDKEGKDTVHVCGTSFCFAGWKAYLDGYTKFVPFNRDPFDYHRASLLNPETGEKIKYWDIRNYATRALGLTEDEADALFEEFNFIEDLVDKINDIEVDHMTDVEFAKALRD